MIKSIIFDLSYTLLFPKDKSYKDELNKLHRQLGYAGGYEFSDYFTLDENILEFVKTLKKKYRLFIYTSGTIQNIPEIKSKLDGMFERVVSASDTGYSKRDREGYLSLAELLNIKPGESLFIDDIESNCSAAKEAGFNTIVYRHLDDLKAGVLSYN